MKIFIVDDHVLIAKALKELLEQNAEFNVLHHFINGLELKKHFENNGIIPDLILLDLNMPLMNGYESFKFLKAGFPQIKIIILSMNDGEEEILSMIKEGVNGYVLKSSSYDELTKAIETIEREEYYFPPSISKLLIKSLNEPIKSNNPDKLSENEITFLKSICSELTYKEIADQMNLSPKTIDGYRDSLFAKLNVKSRTGLVLYAIQNGFFKI
ncbi:MAG: response regulator [Bacteroidia bacterium]